MSHSPLFATLRGARAGGWQLALAIAGGIAQYGGAAAAAGAGGWLSLIHI